MGEKKGKGDDGKDKKKAAEGGGGGEKKKDAGSGGGDGNITVVLKVDMHCEGCAKKVKRSVRGFDGVESVATDSSNNKLTVVGKVDPWKLRERVESKTHKKVVLISPTDPPPKKADEPKKEEKKADDKGEKKAEEKKPKETVVSTAVMKIRLHCEGCMQRIKKTISKYKGVDEVSIDALKDLVTVKGTMDLKSMVPFIREKLKRSVEIVPAAAKKDEGGDKKEKGGGSGDGGGDKEKGGGPGGDGKKEKGGGDGGEKKKEEGGEKKDGGGKKEEAVVNKMEYNGGGGDGGGYVNMPYGYAAAYPAAYPYPVAMAHAPQMFSDENPNACSIM